MTINRPTGILIFIGILVLAAAAYLIMNGKQQDVLTASGTPSSAAEMQFLSLTQQIDPVEIDTAILADPRFQRLIDIRTDILPEASGRQDPFAPLPGIR